MELLSQSEAAQARIAFDLLAGSAPLYAVVQDWLSRRQIAITIALSDAIEEHLKDLSARSRTKNVNNRRSCLYRLKERLGDVQLSDVTLSHCTAFLDALQGRDGANASAKLREAFSLSQDICRHSFASSHIAAFGSFAEEAMEAGHSEAVARRHYVSRVSKADAEAFWQIVPQK